MPVVKRRQLILEQNNPVLPKAKRDLTQLQEQERRKYESKIKSLQEELEMVKRRSRNKSASLQSQEKRIA